jgi:hypothetical protein
MRTEGGAGVQRPRVRCMCDPAAAKLLTGVRAARIELQY